MPVYYVMFLDFSGIKNENVVLPELETV